MEDQIQAINNPAGFWIRLFANILDGIIVGVPLVLLGFFMTGDLEDNITTDIFTNVLSFLYTLLLPVFWNGYTLGKRILGIRIAKVNGEKVGFGTMLMRVIVATLVYAITLGIAAIVSAIMIGVRKDKRSIHDLMAGTYVTRDKP